MSKTLEDYRSIVKILKLKLLKLREQNDELATKVGEASARPDTSFTPKIRKYQSNTSQTICRNTLLMLRLADGCERIGITPEMLFRIADKDRKRTVTSQQFMQILKRVKLELQQTTLFQLVTLLDRNRQNAVDYDDYMAFLCAYQINTEKYPFDSSRNYTQKALIKVAKKLVKEKRSIEDGFDAINPRGNELAFQEFLKFGKSSLSVDEIELTAVFLALDLEEKGTVSRNTFIRELNKAKDTTEIVEEERRRPDTNNNSKSPGKRKSKDEYEQKYNRQDASKKPNKKPVPSLQELEEVEYEVDNDRGVQAGQKKEPKKKEPSGPVPSRKLDAESTKLIGLLKTNRLSADNLINKLLQKTDAAKDYKRSFTLFDFIEVARSIYSGASKQDLQSIYQQIDRSKKGTLTNAELLKFYLLAREPNDSFTTVYKIINRQIRSLKMDTPEQYFRAMSISPDAVLNDQIFAKAFRDFKLDREEQDILMSFLGKNKVQELINKINSLNAEDPRTRFKKLDSRNKTDVFDSILKKIKPEFAKNDFYPKYDRNNKTEQYWKTIFTNQWACWKYCYDTAKKLEEFWKDPEFGPTGDDKSGYLSIVANVNNAPAGLVAEEDIEWINHYELVKRNDTIGVVFMEDSIQPNDINQGAIGNCWFISALSIVAQYSSYFKGDSLKNASQSDLIKGIHPPVFQAFRKYGMFVFRFFKDNNPVFVVVDELIPVQKDSATPLFASCPRLGVQWVSLVQKAYAKLHHTYSSLISGDIAQGLSDLTNCLPIKETIVKKNQDQLCQKMLAYQSGKQLMGCSINPPAQSAEVAGPRKEGHVKLDGEETGLRSGHAYSITDVFTIKNKSDSFTLLRVRNPWGNTEWLLRWSQKPSDPDPEADLLTINEKLIKDYYEQKAKQAKANREDEVEVYSRGEDGTFLMEFQDWIGLFTNLFLGITLSSKWSGVAFSDKWTPDVPSGVTSTKADQATREAWAKKNNQYRLQVSKDADILIIFNQSDGRLYRGEVYPYPAVVSPVLLLVFKVSDKDTSLRAFDKTLFYDESQSMKLEPRRNVTYWKKFVKGTYIVIPMTTGFVDKAGNAVSFEGKFPNYEMNFYYDCDSKNVRVSKVGESKEFRTIEKTRKTGVSDKDADEFIRKYVELGV